MSIIAFQITSTGNIPIQTQVRTLDEITRELPQGFYTTFTTLSKGTKVLGLHMHLQRLYAPAMGQGIDPVVHEPTLRKRIAELAQMKLPKESRIRLILAKNNGAIYIVIQSFEPHSKQIYANGVKVVTAELARQAPRVKDTGFISSSIAQRKQVGRDIFEVLLTKGGKILEGMTSNFYAIKGKTLITAQRGILLGVTRRVILRLARGQGMSIQYRAPHLQEKYDEAFLTSSSRGVVPIISIDNKSVGQGRRRAEPVEAVGKWTKMLSEAYDTYILSKTESILGEMTKVK